jgi:hypothetical protein
VRRNPPISTISGSAASQAAQIICLVMMVALRNLGLASLPEIGASEGSRRRIA